MIFSIFDFDLTCTTEATARRTVNNPSINAAPPAPNSQSEYQEGIVLFQQKRKKGLEEYAKHNQDDACTMVATFHNNPSLIAGFFAALFNRPFTYEGTIKSNNSINIAIAKYSVEGQKFPFLISYIPHAGYYFSKAYNALNNKNQQILDLLQAAKQLTIPEHSEIKFYDDRENYLAATIELGLGIKTFLIQDGANFEPIPRNQLFKLVQRTDVGIYSQQSSPVLFPPTVEKISTSTQQGLEPSIINSNV